MELSHRVAHPLSPDQMQVQVKDGLTAVDARVRDETVTVLIDPFLFCEFPGGREEMPDQLLVLRLERIDRFDVAVRHDQDVRRRDRVDVAEGGHLLVAVDDGRFGFVRNDLAEDARVGHGCSDP